MNVVLLILKIIGIILLCVLGILLLAILLILFVPVRYRLDGQKEEDLRGKARVTWLLHLVVAEVSYISKLNIRIKILGIPFYDRLRKKAKEEKKAEEEEAEPEEEEDPKPEDTAGEKAEYTEPEEEEPEEEEPEEEEPKEEAPKKKAKPKKSFGERLDDVADVIEDGLEEVEDMLDDTADGVEEGIEKLKKKAEDIADTISYYRRILESDGALWVFDYVVRHAKGCLKNVRPRRIDADIRFSNDDPATVADVWKIYAVAVTLIGNIRGNRELDTRQDESSIRFKLRIKGRATAVVLGYHGLCLLLNRKVKKFIRLMKREDKADGGK